MIEGVQLGEVIDFQKGRCLVIQLKGEDTKICMGDQLEFRTPDRKIKTAEVKYLSNSQFLDQSEINGDDSLAFISYTSGVSPRSSVFLIGR